MLAFGRIFGTFVRVSAVGARRVDLEALGTQAPETAHGVDACSRWRTNSRLGALVDI